MTTIINSAYINALLADASYVDELIPNMTEGDLLDKLTKRMTPQLAKYISDNFKVKAVKNADDGGFNAVVWEGTSTEFMGQVFVSMRGTDGNQDRIDDGGLAIKGVAYTQIKEMVNWWLQMSTPIGLTAPQIDILTVSVPNIPTKGVSITLFSQLKKSKQKCHVAHALS